MPDIVIADTSCFIIFYKIEEMEILHSVYNDIFTTPEIAEEFGRTLPGWVIVESVKEKKYQKFIETQVDLGESSAIALAAEKKEALLILGDLKGRKLAKRLGLRFTGSLGVLNKAKEIGVIPRIKPLIEKLKLTDFRIADRVVENLLMRNNE